MNDVTKSIAAALVLAALGCGNDGGRGSSSDDDDDGGGGSGSGASGAGATGSGAGTSGSGGSGPCAVGQIHVSPCCGGPAPACSPVPDGGTCPPGTHAAQCAEGPGCEDDPCQPPPPFCVDAAEVQCSDDTHCSAPGGCFGSVMNGALYCECA
jgi:hypothetical protein